MCQPIVQSKRGNFTGQKHTPEGYNDKENRFFVNVPSENERRIAAQCDSTDKVVIGWSEEQFDKAEL